MAPEVVIKCRNCSKVVTTAHPVTDVNQITPESKITVESLLADLNHHLDEGCKFIVDTVTRELAYQKPMSELFEGLDSILLAVSV